MESDARPPVPPGENAAQQDRTQRSFPEAPRPSPPGEPQPPRVDRENPPLPAPPERREAAENGPGEPRRDSSVRTEGDPRPDTVSSPEESTVEALSVDEKSQMVELWKEHRGTPLHALPAELTHLLAKIGIYTTRVRRPPGSRTEFHKTRETERELETLDKNTRRALSRYTGFTDAESATDLGERLKEITNVKELDWTVCIGMRIPKQPGWNMCGT